MPKYSQDIVIYPAESHRYDCLVGLFLFEKINSYPGCHPACGQAGWLFRVGLERVNPGSGIDLRLPSTRFHHSLRGHVPYLGCPGPSVIVSIETPFCYQERGAYRTRRGPPLRNPQDITFPSTERSSPPEGISAPGQTPRTESQAISANSISQEKWLVLLVIFLVSATLCYLLGPRIICLPRRGGLQFPLEWVISPGFLLIYLEFFPPIESIPS